MLLHQVCSARSRYGVTECLQTDILQSQCSWACIKLRLMRVIMRTMHDVELPHLLCVEAKTSTVRCCRALHGTAARRLLTPGSLGICSAQLQNEILHGAADYEALLLVVGLGFFSLVKFWYSRLQRDNAAQPFVLGNVLKHWVCFHCQLAAAAALPEAHCSRKLAVHFSVQSPPM